MSKSSYKNRKKEKKKENFGKKILINKGVLINSPHENNFWGIFYKNNKRYLIIM